MRTTTVLSCTALILLSACIGPPPDDEEGCDHQALREGATDVDVTEGWSPRGTCTYRSAVTASMVIDSEEAFAELVRCDAVALDDGGVGDAGDGDGGESDANPDAGVGDAGDLSPAEISGFDFSTMRLVLTYLEEGNVQFVIEKDDRVYVGTSSRSTCSGAGPSYELTALIVRTSLPVSFAHCERQAQCSPFASP